MKDAKFKYKKNELKVGQSVKDVNEYIQIRVLDFLDWFAHTMPSLNEEFPFFITHSPLVAKARTGEN